jgi:hypothetical protein
LTDEEISRCASRAKFGFEYAVEESVQEHEADRADATRIAFFGLSALVERFLLCVKDADEMLDPLVESIKLGFAHRREIGDALPEYFTAAQTDGEPRDRGN